jgi:hypothetical protein
MATNPAVPLRAVIRNVINEVADRRRMSAGMKACAEREGDFASEAEMQLAGLAMVPEARQRMNDALTEYWETRSAGAFEASLTSRVANNYDKREIIIGGGFQAAVYAANRVRMGFPRPVVLERSDARQVGGAFAVSLNPVFRLNSRSRPGPAGLPDQDKALNELPGGLIQPSMLSSEEYSTNADIAWIVRLTLAQYADVYPGITVSTIKPGPFSYDGPGYSLQLETSTGTFSAGRVLDARGMGDERSSDLGDRVLTFSQLMARMGGMFPLRGMQQVAVIGGGDAGKCAVESLLGIAPGNSSFIGLDYVTRVDWYTGGSISSQTCSEFRDAQRGRYIKLAQALEGNVSNPSTRLRVMSAKGYATPAGERAVLVNDRTYDMAAECTGSTLPDISDPESPLGYSTVRRNRGTILGTQATPYPAYRIGPSAGIGFSDAEFDAGIAANPPSKVAIFRLAPRTAALATMLGGLENEG